MWHWHWARRKRYEDYPESLEAECFIRALAPKTNTPVRMGASAFDNQLPWLDSSFDMGRHWIGPNIDLRVKWKCL